MNVPLAAALLGGSVLAASPSAHGGVAQAAESPARAGLLADRALAVLYTFGEDKEDAVANHAPRAGVRGGGATVTRGRLVPGRLPGCHALALDDGCLLANSYEPTKRAFSVTLWLRWDGNGTKRGNSNSINGTIIGNRGYREGWRVVMDHRGIVDFCLGTGVQIPSVGARSGGMPVRRGAWQHVACTWDGRFMRVYVNGALGGEAVYFGKYFRFGKPRMLTVGYAGMGVGSMKLVYDEIAIFDRALSQAEVLACAERRAEPGDGAATKPPPRTGGASTRQRRSP